MIMNEPKIVRLFDANAFFEMFPELNCEPYINAPTVNPKTLATITFDDAKLHEFVEKAVDNLKDSILPDGEWVKDDGMTVCSVCGGWRRDNRVDYIAFCNRCGARMKKEVY